MAEQTVTVKARIGTGKKMRIKNVELDREKITSLFHLRQEEAAKALSVSLTSLKVACRRLGINRWPYERIFTSSASNAASSSSRNQDSPLQVQPSEPQPDNPTSAAMSTAVMMDSAGAPSSRCSSEEKMEECEVQGGGLEGFGTCSIEGVARNNGTCSASIDSEWLDWYITCNDDNLVCPDCHVQL
eukprot:751570-Hanusia_phi.AAC.5